MLPLSVLLIRLLQMRYPGDAGEAQRTFYFSVHNTIVPCTNSLKQLVLNLLFVFKTIDCEYRLKVLSCRKESTLEKARWLRESGQKSEVEGCTIYVYRVAHFDRCAHVSSRFMWPIFHYARPFLMQNTVKTYKGNLSTHQRSVTGPTRPHA